MNNRGKCEIMVFYTYSQRQYDFVDKDFGTKIKWDIPLLDGYDYMFIKNNARKPDLTHFYGIKCPHLITEIEKWGATHLLIFGWNYQAHLKAIRYFKGKIPVLFRGDSTLLDYDFKKVSDIFKRDKSINLINAIKSLAKFKIRKAFLTWVYKSVDTALYVGQNNKAYYVTHGLKERQLKFAPHAIDNERFFDSKDKNYESRAEIWRKELGFKNDDIILLYAGKFEPRKNLLFFIEAVNKLQRNDGLKFKIILLGNGPIEKELRQVASNNSNITFLPFQNQSKMPAVYRLADYYCLPSNSETWGLAINEAMACGRLAIVSNKVGCALDLIKNKNHIFESNNTESLISTLKTAVTDSIMQSEYPNPEILINEWNFTSISKAIEKLVVGK
ncbi:glycosyltransferase family 4 protein [Carboxylicivirga sp. RSCT41]|uniref:glycosyltransferase family 4 protein n=1 Tax=Carboxylicivirga agarovorans TaxID=3417570 RepID=UPI003D34B834